MSEDKPTQPPPRQQSLPAPPELFNIPVQLLEQWIELPMNERVVAPLTRQDIDHLIFGLLRTLEAQNSLEKSLVEWSNGNLQNANEAITNFRRQNVEGQNNIRQFVTGLIVSALKARSNAR